MRELGICSNTNAVYEGSSTSCATRVVPNPLLLPIRFLSTDEPRPIDQNDGYSMEIFREESFDPVTKIRRGRVFSRRHQSCLKSIWHVQDHLRSDLPVVNWAHGVAQEIALVNYSADNLFDLRKPENIRHRPRVLLGWEEHCTIWQIVSVETPIHSGPFLTLKALYSLGDLPELVESAIPLLIRSRLVEEWDKLDGTLNRLAAVDVVDRCRAFLSIVFGHLCGDSTRDLSDAINLYAKNGKEDVHVSAGRIVAKLHSRGKPNEQHARDLRPPNDADAQLALRCVGIILLDLGWAR
jgi:hypothetical protein